MNSLITYSAFLAITVMGTMASAMRAGPITSGGGMGVVCIGADGATKSVELLDLYEAKARHHYTLVASSGNAMQDYVDSVKRTYARQGYEDDILIGPETRKNYQGVIDRMRWTAPGKKLPFLNDQGETAPLPLGCHLEQIAIFHDTDPEYIDMDTDLWNKLDPQSQAALVVHELFYKWERTLAEETSEGTRGIVASLFSMNAVPVQEGVPQEASTLLCWGDNSNQMKGSMIYIYKEGDALSFQFFQLMGRPFVTKATASVSGIGMILKKDFPHSIIAEPNMNKNLRVPIEGGHRNDWELSVRYVTGSPVKLGLYQKGILLEENLIGGCRPLKK